MDYEHSELLLYQNMVIQESGDYVGALKHLEAHASQIFDKLAIDETYGDLYLQLGSKLAINQYKELIQRNPENTMYYNKIIEAMDITDPSAIVDLYLEFERLHPKAMPPRRLPLNYATGEQFKNLVDR